MYFGDHSVGIVRPVDHDRSESVVGIGTRRIDMRGTADISHRLEQIAPRVIEPGRDQPARIGGACDRVPGRVVGEVRGRRYQRRARLGVRVIAAMLCAHGLLVLSYV